MLAQKSKQKKIITILRVLKDYKKPIGGTRIAKLIKRYGINLSQRTVRHYLGLADKAGLTKNFGKNGRLITEAGLEELTKSFVVEKVGLVAAKIDEISYKMKFSLNTLNGDIILNISTIPSKDFQNTIRFMNIVFQKKLGMGQFLVIGKPGTEIGDFSVNKGTVAIGTICSVTINGIFLNLGIPVVSRFGGLLEIRDGKPARFTELINYDGSTLDPLEIFIKGRMTKVNKAARSGNGIIGASFREIPSAAILEANRVRKRLDKVGLNGILVIGNPGQPLLDIPVAEGKAGMIVLGGLNPIASLEEDGIETCNIAMGTLFEFKKLVHFSDIK